MGSYQPNFNHDGEINGFMVQWVGPKPSIAAEYTDRWRKVSTNILDSMDGVAVGLVSHGGRHGATKPHMN